MKILGISAFYHDSAVSLIDNGKIISSIQEERLSRKKHDSSFPSLAIKKILELNNLDLNDIDFIVFYEKPFLKFSRIIEICLAYAPKGFNQFLKSIPIWIKEKLFLKLLIIKELQKIDNSIDLKKKIKFSEHHLSHAASTFFSSTFKESLILTIDGVGEWATASINIGKGNNINKISEIRYPNSLGLLYSAFTLYCGFEVNEGEYKLMGLAPYGTPKYKDIIYKNLIEVAEDGSFKLNLEYFEFHTGLKMFNKKFCNLFGKSFRKIGDSEIDIFYMDIAASIQEITEEIIIKICKNLKKTYQIENLCLAGGVALNCVANGKIINEKIFKNVYIQPAAGDAGGALGAALAFWHMGLNKPRSEILEYDLMQHSYLGPSYSNDTIKEFLEDNSNSFEYLDDEKLTDRVSKLLSEEKVIGWFQGKMEFGPRALGNRSILGDARGEKMQSKINQKVKFREGFRPFAPSVLSEKVSEWFELEIESPYMLLVSKIHQSKIIDFSEKGVSGINKLNIKRSVIPAVTHVNLTARIQTVNKSSNPLYYMLIKKFYELTKCPILVNTSFNIKDEPIVCDPSDAYKCFLISDLDYLVMGNYLLKKEDQYKINDLNFLSH